MPRWVLALVLVTCAEAAPPWREALLVIDLHSSTAQSRGVGRWYPAPTEPILRTMHPITGIDTTPATNSPPHRSPI
jgi:hypothetical protein